MANGRFSLHALAGLLLGTIAGGVSPAWADDGGLVGAPLATVTAKSDFFGFFHLVRVGGTDSPGDADYRPDGEKFRPLVRVRVRTDAGGRVTAMTLTILRSFIDDPSSTPFARDIVKSFLRDAPPRSDARALDDLATDIAKRLPPGARVIQGPGHRPATGEPSPDYAVFIGGSSVPVRHVLALSSFVMMPATEDGQPALLVAIERR